MTSADTDTQIQSEPLSIRFANTRYAIRGQHFDGIDTSEGLYGWLVQNDLLDEPASDADVDAFVSLRDDVRDLIAQALNGLAGSAAQVSRLNRVAAAAPRWPQLVAGAEGWQVVEESRGTGLGHALAVIAQDAVLLLGGPLRADLRSCQAPGCVQFFVRNHPRREWCSTACGNRARVARHYLRHRNN